MIMSSALFRWCSMSVLHGTLREYLHEFADVRIAKEQRTILEYYISEGNKSFDTPIAWRLKIDTLQQ